MKGTAVDPVFIYVDESWIEIEGKKHLMLGAMITEHPGRVASKVVRLKEALGLDVFDEIKWNSDRFTEIQRNKLSDGMIHIVRRCIGLISIIEGQDKQEASELITVQANDYSIAHGIPSYFLCFDNDLIPRKI